MDVDDLAGQVVPFVAAAVGAYGRAALAKAEDVAADGTVRLGQRLLAKLMSRKKSRASIEVAVSDLADALDDPDFQAALRVQVKKALHEDLELATELMALLSQAVMPSVTATGDRAAAVGGDNRGIISSGDHAFNIQAGEAS